GNRGVPIELGDQTSARCLVRGAVEDWIEGHQRIAGKIHLRDEARGERRPEQRKMNVSGAPCVVMISPGICSRTNSDEAEAAFGIRHRVSGAAEIWIELSVVLIAFVEIAPGRVGLPNFEESVAN